jgi:hypothetical protein
MRVKINYRGRIRGLDKVLTEVMKADWGEGKRSLGFEQADEISKDFSCLVRELTELAWICMRNAERGRYMGYEVEIFITDRGITWQRYQTEAAPPPLPLLSAWHSLTANSWFRWLKASGFSTLIMQNFVSLLGRLRRNGLKRLLEPLTNGL